MRCCHVLAAATVGCACIAGPCCAGGCTCISKEYYCGLAMVVGARVLALEVIHDVFFRGIPAAGTVGSMVVAVPVAHTPWLVSTVVADCSSYRLDVEIIDSSREILPRRLSILLIDNLITIERSYCTRTYVLKFEHVCIRVHKNKYIVISVEHNLRFKSNVIQYKQCMCKSTITSICLQG